MRLTIDREKDDKRETIEGESEESSELKQLTAENFVFAEICYLFKDIATVFLCLIKKNVLILQYKSILLALVLIPRT